MKKCYKCKESFLLSGFYKNSNKSDGYQDECKICCKKYLKEYRQNKGREKMLIALSKYAIKWKEKYPDRKKAQRITADAILSGKLAKWPICALPECDKPPEAHHPDYSQPLSVVWLCRSHHRQAHALVKNLT